MEAEARVGEKAGTERSMKPRKLRSPIKALQEALNSVWLAMGSPLCVQPTKTESFRDLLASFNSVYYTPAVSSSLSSNAGSLCHQLRQSPVGADVLNSCRGGKEDEAEEEAVSISAATGASTSTCSSCLSSSSATAGQERGSQLDEDVPETAAINSTRFFFSPCRSKFIAGESFHKVCNDLSRAPGEAGESEGEATENKVFDVSPEYSSSDTDNSLEEMAAARTCDASALCSRSIPIALASRDPYNDFRRSMAEMVSAHGLRDWAGLQELLFCYLRLNDQKTHKFIVLAFADLLVHLSARGKIHKSIMHETLFCSSTPLPPPHSMKPQLQSFSAD